MILYSVRCNLRPLTANDREDYVNLVALPEVRKYLGGVLQVNEALRKFEAMLESDAGNYHWIARDKESDRFVGLLALTPHSYHPFPELSYQLMPNYWNNGLGTELIDKILHYAFAELNFHQVLAETQQLNLASCRILKKVGMKLIDRYERFGAIQNLYQAENALRK